MNANNDVKNETVMVEYAAGDCMIQSEADALQIVASCSEYGCNKVLMDSACLAEEFFRLGTGLAGAVLQKFTNYSIIAAVVIPRGTAGQGKFQDFMLETNRGNQFRLFESRETALNWLISA